MNKLIRYCAISLALLNSLTWLPSLTGYAANTAALKRDPFQSPIQHPAGKHEVVHPLQIRQPSPAGKDESAHQPKLRAILYDPKRPLVNIGGQIIEVGESIQGYTLIKVVEREAILSRDGRSIRLSIDGVAAP